MTFQAEREGWPLSAQIGPANQDPAPPAGWGGRVLVRCGIGKHRGPRKGNANAECHRRSLVTPHPPARSAIPDRASAHSIREKPPLTGPADTAEPTPARPQWKRG